MPVIETSAALLALTALMAYLLGSVPFGLVMARLFGLGDIRAIGSGNIGATNVLRTGHKPAAALTLLLDAGKGGVAVLAARALLAGDAAQLAGFAAFLGHCFPVFLGFKGGKGVATFLGTLLALFWPAGIAACLTWAAGGRGRADFLAVGACRGGAGAGLDQRSGNAASGLVTALLAAVIFLRHAANIKRLLNGEEPRIGGKG